MLELARASSHCDQNFFKGWVIAGVEVNINGQASKYTNELVLKNKYRCIMLVQGFDDDGRLQKQLKIVLILPRKVGQDNINSEIISGELIGEHIFTAEEINAYTNFVGDENTLHSQPRPIVPGILLLSWLQQITAAKFLHWKARFLQPVYAGELLQVYEQQEMFVGYVNGLKVFTVNKID